jgi:uncharacterized protein (DUF1778 family)
MTHSDVIQIRVSPAQRAAYQKAANQEGMKLAQWMRRVLDREADPDLSKSGQRYSGLAHERRYEPME